MCGLEIAALLQAFGLVLARAGLQMCCNVG